MAAKAGLPMRQIAALAAMATILHLAGAGHGLAWRIGQHLCPIATILHQAGSGHGWLS